MWAGSRRDGPGTTAATGRSRCALRVICTGDAGPHRCTSSAGLEQRPEEAEALQVVEVKVRQQDVDLASVGRGSSRRREGACRCRRRGRAGARSPARPDAARVAAVAHRVGPGRRERTTTTPHACAHQRSPLRSSSGQNTVTTPCSAPARRTRDTRSRQLLGGCRRTRSHRTRRCAGRRWKNATPAGESAPDIGVAVRMAEIDLLAELEPGELTHLGHRTADQHLGRIVAVDEHAFAIEEEHRRRQVRRELARQDQRQALRRHRRRLHTATLPTGRGGRAGPTSPIGGTGMRPAAPGVRFAAERPDDSAGAAVC